MLPFVLLSCLGIEIVQIVEIRIYAGKGLFSNTQYYFWYKTHLAGNNIIVHSDVVEASPVGAAPIKSSFST